MDGRRGGWGALLADLACPSLPGPLLQATHAELLRQIKARQGHAVEEEAPEGKKRGRGKAGSSKAAEAAAAKMNRPSVPLPPPTMRDLAERRPGGSREAAERQPSVTLPPPSTRVIDLHQPLASTS